jgi:hypothetical protein
MAAPLNPIFDRCAQMTYGLDAIGYNSFPYVNVNYLALVTGFMYGDNWTECCPDPATVWTSAYTLPVTTWTAAYTLPATTWTLVT